MYRDEFYKLLNNKENGIEIGVAKGNYSKILNTWGFKHLYLVDAWEEFKDQEGRLTTQATCNKWMEAVYRELPSAKIIRAKSVHASTNFPNDFFDFIYIDACHEYDAVLDDLNVWFPKCKIGGLFSGHDVNTEHTGVKEALDEFCKSKNLTYKITKGTRRIPPSWYMIKE